MLMNLLDKLGLPYLKDNIVEDFNYFRNSYKELENQTDKRINTIQKRKSILIFIFESLSSFFDLNYDIKLKFEAPDQTLDNNENIYIKGLINMNFDESFYKIYFQCFLKYLDEIHLRKNSNINADLYQCAKLAYLTGDKNMLNKFINNVYCDFIDDRFDIRNPFKKVKIENDDIEILKENNNIRNRRLRNEVLSQNLLDDLSFIQIRNLYRCFSSDIFKDLNVEQKAYLMNLLHNYFSIENKVNSVAKYTKMIDKSTTNKESLKIVINDLLIKGKTMVVRKKNMDMIEDVCSGLPYVYQNETDKNNINSLNDLKKMINTFQK